MNDRITLDTPIGAVVLRPEQSADGAFLVALFSSHTLPNLASQQIDAATREGLIATQFRSQTDTYRRQFPHARFDIIEREATPIGRLVVAEDSAAACIVDMALLPDYRGAGTGSAILGSVLLRLGARVPVVWCTVLRNNEASLRMCRRLDFAHVGGDVAYLRLEWRAPV